MVKRIFVSIIAVLALFPYTLIQGKDADKSKESKSKISYIDVSDLYFKLLMLNDKPFNELKVEFLKEIKNSNLDVKVSFESYDVLNCIVGNIKYDNHIYLRKSKNGRNQLAAGVFGDKKAGYYFKNIDKVKAHLQKILGEPSQRPDLSPNSVVLEYKNDQGIIAQILLANGKIEGFNIDFIEE